jgi:hypothetical protein
MRWWLIWAGGRGADFFLLLDWDYGWTGQHPPVGGSKLESEPTGVRAQVHMVLHMYFYGERRRFVGIT